MFRELLIGGLKASAEGLLPHGFCYLRKADLIWLHVISDGLIAAAYFMIPVILVYFLRRIKTRLSFSWAIGLFAAFIVLCGAGHVMDIITVWHPYYYVQGWLSALTAAVSVATAIAIVPLVPKLLSMRTPEELEEANAKLREEVKARESAEKELRESLADLNRAVRELEQFAYITSHDLQAPLRNIAGFSQLLSRRYGEKLGDDGGEFIEFIDQGVRQMQALILDLLALSRVGRTDTRAERRPLDESLRAAMKSVGEAIEANQAKINFDKLPDVPAVQSLITQLFQNLITNGIKFRNEDTAPEITVSSKEHDDSVEIIVQDNGIGIPDDQLENIFAVFRRLHSPDEFEGTGIGLAICRKIVQHHGGEIWAEPSEVGAKFHIRLPKEEHRPRVSAPASSVDPMAGGSAAASPA